MFYNLKMKGIAVSFLITMLIPTLAVAGGTPTIITQEMPCECFSVGNLRTNPTVTHYVASCPMNVEIDLRDDNSALIGYLNDGRTIAYGVCDRNMYNWLWEDFGVQACAIPSDGGQTDYQGAAVICDRSNQLLANISGQNSKCGDTRPYQVKMDTGDAVELMLSAGGDGSFTACPMMMGDQGECADGLDNNNNGVTDFMDPNLKFNENGDFELPQLAPNENYRILQDPQLPGFAVTNYAEIQQVAGLYGGAPDQVMELDANGHPIRMTVNIPASYFQKSSQIVLSFESSARNKVPSRCYGQKQSFGVYVRRPQTAGPDKLGVVNHYPSQSTNRPTWKDSVFRIAADRPGNYTFSFVSETSCSGGYGSLFDDVMVSGSDAACDSPEDPTEDGDPTPPECSDGEDNDGDGWIDEEDSDCEGPLDDYEGIDPDGDHDCNDGNDNDWDGKIDGADPQCSQGKGTDEYRKKQIFALFECIDKTYDEIGNVVSYTAHLTPFNRSGEVIRIPVGTIGGNRTNIYYLDGEEFTPAEAHSGLYRRFVKGLKTGRLSVTVLAGRTLEWWLGIGGEISSAVVDENSVECAPTTPKVCYNGDTNQLDWYYDNEKYFRPLYPKNPFLGVNFHDPAPFDRGQILRFKKGERGYNAFSHSSDAIDGLTWKLAGNEATADHNSTPNCD